MTNIEACERVLADGCQLVRYRKDSCMQACPHCTNGFIDMVPLHCIACKGTGKVKAVPQYDVKPMFTGSKRGWIMLDSFTASAIVAVYAALAKTQTPENLVKVYRLPFNTLASFAFKHVR